jgi:23S rRNA (adenine2503-C2)-methyltransferase
VWPVNPQVNLIVFNPWEGTRFQRSKDEDVDAFRSVLIQGGFVCTIRDSRGGDEAAACGQLGNVGLSFRTAPLFEAPQRFERFLRPVSAPVGR